MTALDMVRNLLRIEITAREEGAIRTLREIIKMEEAISESEANQRFVSIAAGSHNADGGTQPKLCNTPGRNTASSMAGQEYDLRNDRIQGWKACRNCGTTGHLRAKRQCGRFAVECLKCTQQCVYMPSWREAVTEWNKDQESTISTSESDTSKQPSKLFV